MQDTPAIDSMDRSPAPPPVPVSDIRRIRGWLMFFCVILIVVAPIVSIIAMLGELQLLPRLLKLLPGMAVFVIADLFVSVGIIGFAIYAGVGLLRQRPHAVRNAKWFLLTRFAYGILAALAPFATGLPSSSVPRVMSASLQTLVQSGVFFAVWFAYLSISRRVKQTYAAELGSS